MLKLHVLHYASSSDQHSGCCCKSKESYMGNYKQHVFVEIYCFMLISCLPFKFFCKVYKNTETHYLVKEINTKLNEARERKLVQKMKSAPILWKGPGDISYWNNPKGTFTLKPELFSRSECLCKYLALGWCLLLYAQGFFSNWDSVSKNEDLPVFSPYPTLKQNTHFSNYASVNSDWRGAGCSKIRL